MERRCKERGRHMTIGRHRLEASGKHKAMRSNASQNESPKVAHLCENVRAIRSQERKLATCQCTRTPPFLPSLPSFRPFSIQLPLLSNSPSKFSSSTSSTSMLRCSYLSQSSKSLKSYFRTDTIWVMPLLSSADLRRKVNIL